MGLTIDNNHMRSSEKLDENPTQEMARLEGLDRASHVLLRALVRRPDPNMDREIERLASSFEDWDVLLALAQEHGAMQIVFSRLREMDSRVPAGVRERLKAAFHRNAFHALANAAELISLLQALNHESIESMPFKGVVLATSVYGDLAARPAGDLDLLIHRGDLKRATAILLERGYELKTAVRADGLPILENYFEYHFERPADGMVIELRWRLELASRFKRDLGINWLWPTRRTAVVAGAEVPNISPENTLLLLCMHGSKHIWSRLIWICDVAQLLDVGRELDWDLAIREAKRQGLIRAVALGVLLANRVIGAAVPERILKRFESDSVSLALAKYFEKSVLEAPGVPPPSRIPYYFKLLGFRDRVRLLLTLELLRPNERDFEAVNLPKRLRFLYMLMRPMRLFRDRSPR